MAYYTVLIALSSIDEHYEVKSQITASVNVLALEKDGLFNNVSESTSYLDEAAVIHKDAFAQYLLSDNEEDKAYQWYQNLPLSVKLIIVHKLEWDSGLSD